MNRGTLSTLRDLVPNRALRHVESLRIAELQADRLLKMNDITDGPVPTSIITDIPKIELKRMQPLAVSGCTDWAKGTWVILINGGEPFVRQRFTLAHEFKHILDYRHIDVAYPTTPVLNHRQRTEVVCDYFAGCLLVPRPWLKKLWGEGMQDLRDLAEHFNVSQAAIQTRLLQTGLIDRAKRCDDPLRGPRFMRTSSAITALDEFKTGLHLQSANLENAL